MDLKEFSNDVIEEVRWFGIRAVPVVVRLPDGTVIPVSGISHEHAVTTPEGIIDRVVITAK